MTELLQNLRSLNLASYIGIEDFADRLSFLVTASLLAACCSLVTVRTYFLQPLNCFIPNQFGDRSDGQVEFVNNFCWTEGTYAVSAADFSINSTSPDGGLQRYSSRKIVYYQWVPLMLGLQAALCYLPQLLWSGASFYRGGTDVGHILRVADEAARLSDEKREQLVAHACRLLRRVTASGRFSLNGSWLILTYFLIKMAYLGNCVGQLLAMQRFLQLDYSRYSLFGLSLLSDIVSGRDWHNTMAFPRVGCCAVFLRSAVAGNWQFSQCTLPVNMVNEKVYIFLWFWFIFVAMATAGSMVAWTLRLFSAGIASNFVVRSLEMADNYHQLSSSSHVQQFVRSFIGRDGTFVLKMVSLNCGEGVCAEIIQAMWSLYKQQQLQQQHTEDCLAGTNPEDYACGVLRLGCENLPRQVSVPKQKLALASSATA